MTPLRARDVAASWNAAVPAPYRIDAALVAQNLLDHPLLHDEASGWEEDAFVAIKRSAASLYDGPDPKVAHLSLFAGASSAALRRATEVLRGDGYAALVVGQDSGHFLPGAPTDVPWMGPWLQSQGFVPGGTAHDLERDLSGYVPPDSPSLEGESRFATDADVPEIDAFLAREFPGRWRFDAARKLAAEGPSTIFGLFVGGACEGFAILQREGCRLPIGGAAWQASLGPSWGSLGPIGISKSMRGHGQGRAFLGAALAELRDQGAARTIIDWTGLVEFYGVHGFRVTRSYRAYRLDLSGRPAA